MSNINDYLKWRGDISLKHDELNEIDELILARYSYFPFFKIEMELEETISDISKKMSKFKDDEYNYLGDREMNELIGKSARFKNLKVTDYRESNDQDEEKQFSAITITLNDELKYISFLGTDKSIIGWKEDFNLSFTQDIPAQIEALKYANNMPKKWTIDELVYLTQELNHSVNFSSSVFILKDNGANLKFTFPEGTQFGKTIKGDPLTTEIKHGNFLLIDGNLNYNIRKENQSTSTGNSFSYPTVKNATWEISPTKTGSLEGAINFKVKAEPSVSYRIAFDLTKKKEVESSNSEVVLADGSINVGKLFDPGKIATLRDMMIDEDGCGEFSCTDGSVSVWLEKTLEVKVSLD